MEVKQLANLGQGSTDNKDTDVAYAAAASITTICLLSVNTSSSTPNLSNDELVVWKLKDKNSNSDFAPTLTLPKGKVNKNKFEECMKSSKHIAPIPFGTIRQIFCDKGALEDTAAHQVLQTSLKFNYWNVLWELMYVYIICRPNIGYAIITLSKFSSEPSAFHYKFRHGVAKYFWSTITWGMHFNWTSLLNIDKISNSVPYPELANSNDVFPVDVNRPVLQVFTDVAFENNLTRRRSTTGIIFTYCGGAIVYQSKTQTLTAGSSTEAELIATVMAVKLAWYLWCVLKQLGEKQTE